MSFRILLYISIGGFLLGCTPNEDNSIDVRYSCINLGFKIPSEFTNNTMEGLCNDWNDPYFQGKDVMFADKDSSVFLDRVFVKKEVDVKIFNCKFYRLGNYNSLQDVKSEFNYRRNKAENIQSLELDSFLFLDQKIECIKRWHKSGKDEKNLFDMFCYYQKDDLLLAINYSTISSSSNLRKVEVLGDAILNSFYQISATAAD